MTPPGALATPVDHKRRKRAYKQRQQTLSVKRIIRMLEGKKG